jgi:cyclic pyranopterin phosphate synthase
MPAEGFPRLPRDHLLSFEEQVRVVRLMAGMGVERIRLTGGEPLIRRDAVALVERLKAIKGIQEVAMTTNGHLLARHAEPLWAAGLRGLNVSIDTFDSEAFARITRGGDLFEVLRGIEAAQEAGFTGIKVNAVSMRGLNDQDHVAFVEHCWRRDLLPRFIELMPIGQLDGQRSEFVSSEAMLTNINAVHPLHIEGAACGVVPSGPAHYAVVTEGPWTGRKVGFISPMSDDGFCDKCNRARLTARGGLRACLADDREVSILQAIREGADDESLVELIAQAVSGKRAHHNLRGATGAPLAVMTGIGG